MRLFYFISIIFLFTACATQHPAYEPQPKPIAWTPGSPDNAVVVFNDDSANGSQLRDTPMALALQDSAVSRFSSRGFDSVSGSTMTNAFLNHGGRRGPSEVVDSLSMLKGWGYALSLSYYVKIEQTDQYGKLWLTLSSKLYDAQGQRLVKSWKQTQAKHVIVALDCDQYCVEQTLQPYGESLVDSAVSKSVNLIRQQHSAPPAKAKPSPYPDYINVEKPDPVPTPVEPEPAPPADKSDWHPINF